LSALLYRYTFEELWREEFHVRQQENPSLNSKVMLGENCLIFNTGLLSRNGRCDVFMMALPNDQIGTRPPPYIFSNWVSQDMAKDAAGKEDNYGMRTFSALCGRYNQPHLVDFFRGLIPILQRFELDFDDELSKNHVIQRTMERIPGADAMDKKKLDTYIRDDMHNDAKWVSRNYSLAVPQWYPTTCKVQHLLPLYLGHDRPVGTLIVDQSKYNHNLNVVTTVIDIGTAYSNARLLCKQETEWMRSCLFDSTEQRSQSAEAQG